MQSDAPELRAVSAALAGSSAEQLSEQQLLSAILGDAHKDQAAHVGRSASESAAAEPEAANGRSGHGNEWSGCVCEGMEQALRALKRVAWRRSAVKVCTIFFPVHLQAPGAPSRLSCIPRSPRCVAGMLCGALRA